MTILDTFTTRDGAIEIGGLPLSRLAERAGRTPFFAYDRSKLAERVALLRRWLAPDIRIHYSIKANPMPALVHCMAGLVDGFDVASAGELRVALDTGMAAEHIALAGPGKTELDVRSTVGAGATLTLESVHQLDAAARAGQALGVRPRVALRINPDFQPKTSGMRMGGGPRQFGIDAEQAPGVLAAIAQRDLDFRGFHVFWGSQCLDADTVISAQRHVAELVVRLADQANAPVAFVNMGAASASRTSRMNARWTWSPSARPCGNGSCRCGSGCPKRGWRWSSAAIWSARQASMSVGSWTRRCPGEKPFW